MATICPPLAGVRGWRMGGMKDEKNRLRIADCEIENLQGIKGKTEKDEARGRMQDPGIVETGLKPVSTLGENYYCYKKLN